MINPTDAPSLLSRAGLTLTTVDVEDFTINYPSMWELINDLRDMGESNAILGRKSWVSRDVLLAAEAIYKGALLALVLADARAIRKGRLDPSDLSNHLHGKCCSSAFVDDADWLATWTQRAKANAAWIWANESQRRIVETTCIKYKSTRP